MQAGEGFFFLLERRRICLTRTGQLGRTKGQRLKAAFTSLVSSPFTVLPSLP